jgi:hypothetical protein
MSFISFAIRPARQEFNVTDMFSVCRSRSKSERGIIQSLVAYNIGGDYGSQSAFTQPLEEIN